LEGEIVTVTMFNVLGVDGTLNVVGATENVHCAARGLARINVAKKSLICDLCYLAVARRRLSQRFPARRCCFHHTAVWRGARVPEEVNGSATRPPSRLLH